ncbi:MAG: tyrosine-type recombinase/integrase, partial [Actinophytocola sp.]|nr:tyrosine-type recombinase/integrase [Actinophytocola sp.]
CTKPEATGVDTPLNSPEPAITNPANSPDQNMINSGIHCSRRMLSTSLMDGATIREVMDQLGHASITTTANIYGHVLDAAKRKMADRMNQRVEAD